jgi:hypothetical protein
MCILFSVFCIALPFVAAKVRSRSVMNTYVSFVCLIPSSSSSSRSQSFSLDPLPSIVVCVYFLFLFSLWHFVILSHSPF